jgi:hypothetical protein
MNCKDIRQAIILDHYGELSAGEKTGLEEHLRTCPDCSADREETRRVLDLVTAQGTVEVPAFEPEQAWRAIRAGLRVAAPRRRTSFAPGLRWGLAGAGVALILVAGVLIGRFGLKPSPGPAPVNSKMAAIPAGNPTALPASNLQPSLATHLDDLRPILLDIANSAANGSSGGAVTVDERLLRALMLQNILLRRALNGNDPAATELLDDLDLVLKEIVNAKSPGGATPAQVKGLIQDRSILLRMQVLKTI